MPHPDAPHISCETCPYFDGTAKSETGHCRRSAPQADGNDVLPMPVWPVVGRGMWCGDHPRFQFAFVNRGQLP